MDKIKVIFLDIDGVLQPYKAGQGGERFKVDRHKLVADLTEKHNIDYSQYNEYDVAAVYCDWDQEALSILKNILIKAGAKIAVSSDWREPKNPNKMRDLLRIHNLDEYYIGDTPDFWTIPNYNEKREKYSYRVVEITEYLEQNKDRVEQYVAIDDMNLSKGGYVGNFIHTYDLITKEQGEKCIRMLTGNKEHIDLERRQEYDD